VTKKRGKRNSHFKNPKKTKTETTDEDGAAAEWPSPKWKGPKNSGEKNLLSQNAVHRTHHLNKNEEEAEE